MPRQRKEGRQRPLYGTLMQEIRESKGIATRDELAEMLGVSVSAVEKIELGHREPTREWLAHWFNVLDPLWFDRKKLIHLLFGELYPVRMPPWPMKFTEADERFFGLFGHLVCVQAEPLYDLYWASKQFSMAFPGLETPSPDADRPTNIIEWTLLHPAAREVLPYTWRERAHVMLTGLRRIAPGLVPQARIDAVVESLKRSPEFEWMWNTEPDTETEILNQVVPVRDLHAGEIRRYEQRPLVQNFPPGAPITTLTLYTLTPMLD